MRATTVTNQLARLPAALLAKAQAEAEQDADDVADFIRRAALRCSAKSPKRQAVELPREALLGLGLALRLHRWERIGLPIHLAFGLPSATEVMRFVTAHMQGPQLEQFIKALLAAVTQTVSDYLLWSSPDSNDCVEMVIAGAADEDVLLDAVVELVFQAALRRSA